MCVGTTYIGAGAWYAVLRARDTFKALEGSTCSASNVKAIDVHLSTDRCNLKLYALNTEWKINSTYKSINAAVHPPCIAR